MKGRGSLMARSRGVAFASLALKLRGRDVLTAGIATHYVPQSRVEALERHLLEISQDTQGKTWTLDSNRDFVDQEQLTEAIRALDEAPTTSGSAAAAAPQMLHAASLAEINEIFGLPSVEAIASGVASLAADAAARGDGAHWAVAAARELDRASPTSLLVTHEALRRGAACATLNEALEMEFRMAQRFLLHPDFVAGVGAVLSKEKERPVWASPPSAAQLEEWFATGEAGELGLASSQASS